MDRASSYRSLLVFSCFAGIAFPLHPVSAATNPANPAIRAAIDAAVQKERRTYGGKTPVPGVLVGVWDAAGNEYVKGYGFADVAAKRPMSRYDQFRIGSNTKTFVVSVILQLVDEKKLGLDDPISKFDLGVKVPNARNITVRELCDMRSGLFEAYETPEFDKMNFTPKSVFDPRTVIAWAVKQKPYFAPNAGYHYTNTGYLLLGLIIENITKDTVGNQIRKRLIEPFGLTHTSYPSTQAMPSPWARGYTLDKKRDWFDDSNTVPVSLMGAAGLMISDMADMKRWIKLYVTGKTSKPATHRALMDCKYTGHGNLYFGLALGCSAGWYGYTGGLPGYNTGNYYFPASGITIVAWVDSQRNDPKPGAANAIFRALAKIMVPGSPVFRIEGSKGSSGL